MPAYFFGSNYEVPHKEASANDEHDVANSNDFLIIRNIVFAVIQFIPQANILRNALLQRVAAFPFFVYLVRLAKIRTWCGCDILVFEDELLFFEDSDVVVGLYDEDDHHDDVDDDGEH